jgi:hypothetical protein
MPLAVVSGALANKPGKGGAAWTRLSYVLGLRRLGFCVYFVEQIDSDRCTTVEGGSAALEESTNLAYFRQVTARFGLAGSSALICDHGTRIEGLSLTELLELAESADLLINLTGHLTLEPLKSRFRRKIYVDLDPGYTQLWHASGLMRSQLEGHDAYYTVGENVGTASCPIASNGIAWRPTRPPVVLDQWPVTVGGNPDRFTTVASWRGPYGPVPFGNATLGQKVHEFRKLLDLPRRSGRHFEIALDIHPADEADRDALRDCGWHVVDPRSVASDPDAFRRYVQGSGAEFSAAQQIYVATASGWFSDRTVRYLASGKPALVQDTGFCQRYPVGQGLLAFRTLDEAVTESERVARDYEGHCQAARAIAESFFDSDRVLSQMIEELEDRPSRAGGPGR